MVNLSLCINYRCLKSSPKDAKSCEHCGAPLSIHDRFRVLQPLRPLEQSLLTQIFEVEDVNTQKRYVLKVVNSQDCELVEPLMLTTLALRRIHTLDTVAGIPQVEPDCYFMWSPAPEALPAACLAVEKIDGVPLDRWLQTQGRISQDVAIQWLVQLITLADAFHQEGYLHRDIKPANLIRQHDGSLALVDFDTLCKMDSAYVASLDSQRVRILDRTAALTPGTPGYCAPEQSDGQAVPASDLFAIGRTMIHLLTGEHPVLLPRNSYTSTLVWRHKAPQIDPLLADFIDRLIAPNPINRPHQINKIVEYLYELPARFKQRAILRSNPFRAVAGLLMGLGLWGGYRLIAPLYASYYANHYLAQAVQMQSAGAYPMAEHFYRTALRYEPSNSTIHSELAMVCALRQNSDCAVDEFQRALALSPDNVFVHYNLANVYDQMNRQQLAEYHYKEAARFDSPVRINARNNLARLQILQDRPQVAITLIEQDLLQAESSVTKAALYKNLGWALYIQKKPQQSLRWLKDSIQLDPTRTDTYCLLAKTREALAQDASADWMTCLMLQSSEDQPEVQEWRAEILGRVQLP